MDELELIIYVDTADAALMTIFVSPTRAPGWELKISAWSLNMTRFLGIWSKNERSSTAT